MPFVDFKKKKKKRKKQFAKSSAFFFAWNNVLCRIFVGFVFCCPSVPWLRPRPSRCTCCPPPQKKTSDERPPLFLRVSDGLDCSRFLVESSTRCPFDPLPAMRSFLWLSTAFYRVLPGFTGFLLANGVSLVSSSSGWVLLGFTGFYWLSTAFYLVLPDFAGFYWVLMAFYRVLPSFTEFYRVFVCHFSELVRLNGFSRVLS